MKVKPTKTLHNTKRAKPRDLTGKRFGNWIVLNYAGKKSLYKQWFCRCDCGIEKNVYEISLVRGRSKRCMRCAWDSKIKYFPEDFIGKRFGKWLVLKPAGKHTWLCRCDCGAEKEIPASNLINKRSTQCRNCFNNKCKKSKTKLYRIWHRLKCQDLLPKAWQKYETFKKAVGDPPNNDAQLRRYDSNKPHSPRNTFWFIFKKSHLQPQLKEQAIIGNKMLMKIRKAKTKDGKIRSMVTARKAGCTFHLIGFAAGISRQAAHIIITKHLKMGEVAKPAKRAHRLQMVNESVKSL